MVYELNEYSGNGMTSGSSLSHHGILGMKWGVRRYQNPDGTLTPEGMLRYYGKHQTDKFTRLAKGVAKGTTSTQKLGRTGQIKILAKQIAEDYKTEMTSAKQCQEVYNRRTSSRKFVSEWREKAANRKWVDWRDKEKGWPDKNASRDEKDSRMLNLGYVPQYQSIGRYNFQHWYGDPAFSAWLLDSGDSEAKQFRANMKSYNAAQERIDRTCRKMIDSFIGETNRSKFTDTQMEKVYKRGMESVERILNRQNRQMEAENYRRDFLDVLRS